MGAGAADIIVIALARSVMGEKAKFRRDRRTSPLAPKADYVFYEYTP
jgi:hypothetical protein